MPQSYKIPSPDPYVHVESLLYTYESILRDIPEDSEKRGLTLEKYFNDIYAVFLDQFTRFALQAHNSKDEMKKLRWLFDELIRTRKLLEEINIIE